MLFDDILEEIVGEVMDVGYTFEGHLPRHKYHIEKLEDEAYLIDGRLPVTEVRTVLDVTLPPINAHTVGGMMTSHLHPIPTKVNM